jgi:HPt (histidine-containing phosphotransfer) domain-containing protein
MPEQIVAEVDRVLGKPSRAASAATALPETFEALRVEYESELPERLGRLCQQLRTVQQRPRDTVLFAEVRREAHELAGTAGSFGFDDLTVLGNQLEAALLKWQGTALAATWAPIAQALSTLEWWLASLPVAA